MIYLKKIKREFKNKNFKINVGIDTNGNKLIVTNEWDKIDELMNLCDNKFGVNNYSICGDTNIRTV